MAEKNKSNSLYITRIYDAPVAMVWDAWTDPEQVAQWWGPRGFTITHHSKDLKPGGHWSYTMHGPDGVDYPNRTTYYEVEKYKRLVYDHGANETQPPLFRVTVVFTELKNKTKMEMTMTLPTPEAAQQIKGFIKQAGGNATWDRLAEYLDKKSLQKETFFINRSFEAPINLMYELWTQPNHFSKWMGPTGSTMEFIRAEIKEGGSCFYKMTFDTGLKMYGKIKYLTLNSPNTLIYTQQFSDEHEGIGKHPMAPVWPTTMLTTVTLAEEEGQTTRVTVKWEPCETFTDAELEAFVKERTGMTMGWTGSFDKLEEFITKL